MNQQLRTSYLDEIIKRNIFGNKRLLIWDRFKPHYTDMTQRHVRKLILEMRLISSGLTLHLWHYTRNNCTIIKACGITVGLDGSDVAQVKCFQSGRCCKTGIEAFKIQDSRYLFSLIKPLINKNNKYNTMWWLFLKVWINERKSALRTVPRRRRRRYRWRYWSLSRCWKWGVRLLYRWRWRFCRRWRSWFRCVCRWRSRCRWFYRWRSWFR